MIERKNKFMTEIMKRLLLILFLCIVNVTSISDVFAADPKDITSSDIILESTGQPWATYQDPTVYANCYAISPQLYDNTLEKYITLSDMDVNVYYDYVDKMLCIDITGKGNYTGSGTLRFYKKENWYALGANSSSLGSSLASIVANFDSKSFFNYYTD